MMGDGYGHDHGRAVCDEEFSEEEVWAVMQDKMDGSPKSSRRLSGASRLIPKSTTLNTDAGGGDGRKFRHSAPISIPDWSTIYSQKKAIIPKSSAFGSYSSFGDPVNEEEEYDEDCRLPPHELIARKIGRTETWSSSVCEGAGRTLKGRDLRKVRNAVLTRTGFLE